MSILRSPVFMVAAIAAVSAANPSTRQRVRYGPGVCGPIDPVYVRTATETGGQPFPLSTAEVVQSSRIMQTSLFPETILWASASTERSYSIPVDSSVTRMMVSGTFDGTGGSLSLMGPDGAITRQGDRIEDTPLNCGRIITVDAPASGNWQLRVTPTGRFWLQVIAKSDLSMSSDFVERDSASDSDAFVKIQGRPIAGRPATLRVRLSSSVRNASFQLVALDARPIQAVELQSSNNREFSGAIELPAEPFRVAITGVDESAAPVRRVSRGLSYGEAIEVVPAAGERTVSPGSEVPVTFTIRNHGAATRLRLVATDRRGKIVPVEPATLELGGAAEGSATVRLVVPSDELDGPTSIRLTASRDDAGEVGGFNSAEKTFTVIRK
jgi:hypothetical protein